MSEFSYSWVMLSTAPKIIRLGHSPDPDDAFMFYAFAKNKIDMKGFHVEHVVADIESLNQKALRAELEVTAVSCHAYAYLAEQYAVMRSGASVGDQYGPILVAAQNGVLAGKAGKFSPADLRGKKVAVPGKLTTAYLALQLFEKDFKPVFTPFDRIFEAVSSRQVDLGLIIHEGQLTYQQKGYQNVLDLGVWWFERHGLPLPLGIDVIRRDLGEEAMRSFSALFKKSIQYALDHRAPALEYAREFGRGISENLNDRFVGMYVNDDTVDLDAKGQAGLRTLLQEGHTQGLLPRLIVPEFI